MYISYAYQKSMLTSIAQHQSNQWISFQRDLIYSKSSGRMAGLIPPPPRFHCSDIYIIFIYCTCILHIYIYYIILFIYYLYNVILYFILFYYIISYIEYIIYIVGLYRTISETIFNHESPLDRSTWRIIPRLPCPCTA